MADQLSSIGSPRPMFDPKKDQAHLNNKSEVQLHEKTLLNADDRVSLDSTPKAEPTYGPIPGVEVGSPYQLLRSLVVKTLEEQGLSLTFDTGSEIMNFQNMTPEEAQQLVSEDGFFGVEKTSDRIVNFAINAFGDDPEKFEEMRAAIEDGFKQAADAFGGSLPEISHQTYDAVMEKLDAFAGLKTDSGE